MDHIYIFATIIFACYGQLIMKWRSTLIGSSADGMWGKLVFLGKMLSDPFVMTGYVTTFLSVLAWMIALNKFELSYAYAFTTLTFIIVMLCGCLFFNEQINMYKIFGSVCIIIGILIVSKGC